MDQIDRGNVDELRMVWTRAMRPGTNQGTPLAYGGVLYMPNPNDVTQAIDAVTGDLLWEYVRPIPEDVDEYIRGLAQVNRAVAIHGNLNHRHRQRRLRLRARRADRPAGVETEILNYQETPARHSTGPIIANGKVISGRSCRPWAGPEPASSPRTTRDRGGAVAHAPDSGPRRAGRRDVGRRAVRGARTCRLLDGAQLRPGTESRLRRDVGHVAGAKFLLGGADNRHLYHNSTLALDGDTGAIRWYYQHLNDHWDLDHPFERLLVDTAVAPDPSAVSWINPNLRPGEMRRVVTGIPGKTGVVYTLDRATGEFLWATPTITQNVISGIDGATGAVSENSEVVFSAEGQEVLTCPELFRGQGLGDGRLQPADQHHVLPAAKYLRADAGHDRRGKHLRARDAQPDYARDRPGGHGAGHFRRDRRHGLEVRAALGHHVARRHGRVGCCSAGTSTAGSGRSTRIRARCCGRSTSARRSPAFRSPMPLTVANTSPSAPARRTPPPRSCASRRRSVPARPTTCSCSRFRTERRPPKNQAQRPPSPQGPLGRLRPAAPHQHDT